MDMITELMALVPRLAAGEMAAVGSLIMLVVRVYRMFGGPWPTGGKAWIAQLVIFLVSLLASLLVGALAGGVSWPVALVEAFAIGATAITGHEVTAAIGAATRAPVGEQADGSTITRQNIGGRVASIILPPPRAQRITINKDGVVRVEGEENNVEKSTN